MTPKNTIFAVSARIGLCAALSLTALSATAAFASSTAPFAPSPLRGQTVYNKACAACHGETGNGKGQGAGPLDPKPRDFTTGIYKFRSTGLGELPTDADLMKTLELGLPGTQMPSFAHTLTAQERADVVAYIKKFSPDFDAAEEEPTVIEIPEAPASTPEFVAEGKNVFMALDCWTCHGAQGKGNGPAGKALKDGWGNPIKPQNLTRKQYKSGSDAASIYRIIHTGLNGTPMSAFGGAFGFGSGKEINEEGLMAAYSKAEVEAFKAYLAAQPAAAKDDVVQQRKWALVHYVRSLQKQSLVQNLFIDDTEVTK